MGKKPGRNEKCPCGSGRKYKKCCLGKGIYEGGGSAPKKQASFFESYNTADLLKTFAGLSITPANHGKYIRFEELSLQAIINLNSAHGISYGSLKDYFGRNYQFHAMEDPPVNLFTQVVTFYGGDYLVFPGINEGGSYILSNLLSAIFNWENSEISQEFKDSVRHVSLLALNLSDRIARQLGYSRYIKGEAYEEKISLPSEQEVAKLKKAVSLTSDEMADLLEAKHIDPKALSWFILDKESKSLMDADAETNPLIERPIVEINGEFIVASPANLQNALTELILSQAEMTGCMEQVGSAYHNWVWYHLQMPLQQMKFSLLGEWEFDDHILPIKESIYQFDDDKLAYVQYVYDDRSQDNPYAINFQGTQKRKEEVVKKLKDNPSYQNYEFLDITIVSPLNRDFPFSVRKSETSRSLTLTVFDFDVLVQLEEYDGVDLWNFVKALEEQLENQFTPNFSFLDHFQVYREHNDSFYLNDDTGKQLNYLEYGYGADLIQEAQLNTDKHSAIRWFEYRLVSIPVQRIEKFEPIYIAPSDIGSNPQYLIEGFPQPIWVTPKTDLSKLSDNGRGMYWEMSGAINYWLWQATSHLAEPLAAIKPDPITITFRLLPEEKFDPIERQLDRQPGLEQHFTVAVFPRGIDVEIPSEIIPYLYGADNEGERVLLKVLIQGLSQFLVSKGESEISKEEIQKIVDQVAPLGSKKKVFILDTADNLLLDPSHLIAHRLLQDYNVSQILDQIGPELRLLGSLPKEGLIKGKSNKTDLIKHIVIKVLLPKLGKTINQYQMKPLLERLIGLNESLINYRENLRIKTPTRIACYVSEEQQLQDLQETLPKISKTSLAVRCLIEHMAAEQVDGGRVVSTAAVDELIAIMSQIVEFASLGDQLEYELFDIDIGILPTGRVGTDKTPHKDVFDPYFTSKSKENLRSAIENYEQVFPQHLEIKGKEVPANLDAAFEEEFGLSFTHLAEFVNDLGIVAYKSETFFAAVPKSDLFVKVNGFDHTFSEEEFERGLNFLTLYKRGKVGKVPDGFESFDIKPWRFNRRLSLLRRPLVALENPDDPDNPVFYWGFRQLLKSRFYLQEQCMDQRLRVQDGGPVDKVLGKLIQANGRELVESVVDNLEAKNLIIDSEVPIRPNSILKNKKDIGDVDVLIIDQSTRLIYSLECKSMAPSRNIKEMVEEVTKLFGTNSKRGWLDKHVERDQWLKENISLVGSKYDLDLTDYEVKSYFVTAEDMLTPYLKNRELPIPFVTSATLKKEGLNALK